jgi:hypothetical protein
LSETITGDVRLFTTLISENLTRLKTQEKLVENNKNNKPK